MRFVTFFSSVLIKYVNCHKCSSSLALDNNNERQYRAGKSGTNGSGTSHSNNILGTVVAVAVSVLVVIAVAKFPFVFWKWRKMMLLGVE